GWRADVSRAALANGVLIGAFECEPLTGSHASGTVLPSALAVCQRERLDGAAFITALAVGFEVSARLARTAVGLETVRGFHNPGTQGPFGAAAAVGKLYALDEERLTSAMGIAGSSSAGLLEFAWSGGDTKRLHLGRAAQLGLESALLARQDVRGPATVLEGRYGYFNAFSTPPRMERLLEDLGTVWAIEPPSHKSYATHVTQQAVVDAIQSLKREWPFDPRTITRVGIRGAPRGAPREPGLLAGRDHDRVRERAPYAAHPSAQGLTAQPLHLGRCRREVSALHGVGAQRPAGDGHRRRGRWSGQDGRPGRR